MTPSSSPTTPKITRPRRTETQPQCSALPGSRTPSDWLTSVAVAVPNARQAVKVGFSTPTMIMVAALFTAPSRGRAVERHRRVPQPQSSWLTIIENRRKPVMTAIVAMPLGTESFRISQVRGRERRERSKGRYVRTYSGSNAQPAVTNSPIHVEMKPASPAPAMPMRGAPRLPKMNTMQSTMFTTFMMIDAIMWTRVLPRPSKNALNENVVTIDVMPSRRHSR